VISLVIVIVALPKLALPSPVVVRRWQVAFERKSDIWIANGDGTNARVLLKNGTNPSWSRDGKRLAFRRGSNICVYNLQSKRLRAVAKIPASWIENVDAFEAGISMEWDPLLPVLLYSGLNSTEVHAVVLSGPVDEGQPQVLFSEMRDPGGKNYGAQWSPDGKTLAFLHSGDIWIADRDPNCLDRSQPFDARDYYWKGRRLAALAQFSEDERSASASTPYWVDEVEWTRNERRLAFHFQRIGGSGVSEIGYIDLSLAPKESLRWEDFSGFRTRTHWLIKEGFFPRICPDGHTLSYVTAFANDTLTLVTWDGKTKRKLFDDVFYPAWRPALH